MGRKGEEDTVRSGEPELSMRKERGAMPYLKQEHVAFRKGGRRGGGGVRSAAAGEGGICSSWEDERMSAAAGEAGARST